MARTKREYILATCFLSGAAAILSLVAVGTQEWITSEARSSDAIQLQDEGSIKFGLFGGVFQEKTPLPATVELTTVCAWDLNVCALLCNGDEDTLRKMYNNEAIEETSETACTTLLTSLSDRTYSRIAPRDSTTDTGERIFINTGVWLCTILFLILSAVMGLFSAGLAVWNTATSPHQVYLSVFGLYIYNAIAFFSVLLSIVLWGAMFAQDLRNNIPTYKTFFEYYTTKDFAQLGYSYWINLASLFLYMVSISLLYIRNYLISKEPNGKPEQEEPGEPVIYLY